MPVDCYSLQLGNYRAWNKILQPSIYCPQWTDPSRTKLPDGELIEPPKTHYQLDDKHFGIDNLAHAIYVPLTKHILCIYLMHACYAE